MMLDLGLIAFFGAFAHSFLPNGIGRVSSDESVGVFAVE